MIFFRLSCIIYQSLSYPIPMEGMVPLKHRILCVILTLLLLTSVLPAPAFADAGSDSAIPDSMIDSLKAKFPDGKYWNHDPAEKSNPDAWTETPCTHHESGICSSYNGACGCNVYDSAIQCMGFAFKLANECFTGSARKWTLTYDLDGLKAGDIVRMNGHSVFVTAVRGEMVTFADCNIDHQCGIRWDAQISKTLMKSRLDYRLVSPNQMVPDSPRITVNTAYHQWDTITVNWSAVSGIDYYVVQLDCDGGTLASYTTKNCSFSFEAELDGVYRISVASKNSVGKSPAATAQFIVDAHACASKAFWDVPNYDNWAHEGIDYAVSTGLFNGVSDDSFGPGGMMTRAMIATVLWRNSGSPNVEGELPYADVGENLWYSRAILWAYQNNIMNGVGEGLFEPDTNLDREQIVTVLYRYAAFKGVAATGTTALNQFADGNAVSGWAKEAMQWAVANQIIKGSSDSNQRVYLYPQSPANRAQVATILMRFVRDYIRVPDTVYNFS